ncbi:uncharacterized protein LOC109805394 [Cajanus cajan]|uniref:uncharacterized protein LOC109805394 n=1 Tax=Cajanus cajan TaxID=3821 RepID=UPI00098DABFD|nr:uncharacterized protein LOC109805394 [Cajanus cajan]
MIEKMGPVDGLNSAEVFLQRSIVIVDHWKRRWKKHLAELERARKGEAELQSLKKDLSKTQKSLEIVVKANEAYVAQVGELVEVAKFAKDVVEFSRTQVQSLEEENSTLKAELGEAAEKRLCDEVLLVGREEEIGALKMDIDVLTSSKKNLEERLLETEHAVVVEHRRGFAKAVRQAKLLAAGVDLSAMHIEKDV